MRVLIRLLKALLPLIVIGVAGLVAVTMVRSRPEVETQAPTVAPPGVRAHSGEPSRRFEYRFGARVPSAQERRHNSYLRSLVGSRRFHHRLLKGASSKKAMFC